ncbi:transcription regulator bdf1 [Ophiostoma piceae UAMH 11346]|uniref:Transcription regulator bdf1 n=1 Tax=Ophiostoma piceae (strain UAMH 11346) TaxID=1262450 RepID=S3C306_OPHP1|nr:transcription regulator bdf1 [Ophiostoma piceae UAMH 11346]
MAVITTPLADTNTTPSKMASLADEQPTNGVNGHSDDATKLPQSDSLKTAVDVSKNTDVSEASAAKNADSFNSNATLLDKDDVSPAEADSTLVEKDDDKPADKSDESEAAPEPAAAAAVEPKDEESAKETATDAPEEAETAEKTAEAVAPKSESADAAPASEVAAAKDEDAAKADADAKTASSSGAKTVEKDADVDMADATDAADAAAASSTPTPAKSASPEKAKSPTVPAPATHSLTSSLLPSLRDDRSRDNSISVAGNDTSMSDTPAKVAREREDDDETGRSPKRAKTADVEAPASKAKTAGESESSVAGATEMQIDVAPVTLPPRVRAIAKEGSLAHPSIDDNPISVYANREIRRVLASVKKTKAGLNFKDPVHKKWPMLWDSYTARVSKPVDIGLLERNLRENLYASHGDFVSDLFLIHENSISFNGSGNAITDEAKSLVDNFFTRLSEVSAAEPQKPDTKKEPKTLPTRQTEPRAATHRRESRGAATSPIEDSVIAVTASPIALSTPFGQGAAPSASGTSPGPAASVDSSTQAFAVPASGVPIIRRDSAKNDSDRPKRPIHPPKNRDLGYEPKNPKKRLPEFRFCDEVLKDIVRIRNYELNHWFMRPVDPVAMGIPTYFKIIKKPMDLGTMQEKLAAGEYASAKDFENDFNLIVRNCRKFNIVGEVVDAANRLEDIFKAKWAEKDAWIAAHTTQTATHSPSGGKDDDSEEEEDSDDDGEVSAAPPSGDIVEALGKRLDEENTRLNKLLAANVPDMTAITTQQTVIQMIQKQLVEEKIKLATAETERRNKKASKSKSSKSKKASGAASSSSAKKSSGSTIKKPSGAAVKKAPKARVLGQAEKNVVTEGINNLDGNQLERAIEIIKRDTSQEESEDGELELDIDQLSQDALGKLYDLIIRAFPHMRIKTEKIKTSGGDGAAKQSKPKKHKPMGKAEQERNIEKLREIKAQFQRPGSGSQEPLPSVEVGQGGDEEEESEMESEVDSEEE